MTRKGIAVLPRKDTLEYASSTDSKVKHDPIHKKEIATI
jgi:hypothetical protein